MQANIICPKLQAVINKTFKDMARARGFISDKDRLVKCCLPGCKKIMPLKDAYEITWYERGRHYRCKEHYEKVLKFRRSREKC